MPSVHQTLQGNTVNLVVLAVDDTPQGRPSHISTERNIIGYLHYNLYLIVTGKTVKKQVYEEITETRKDTSA